MRQAFKTILLAVLAGLSIGLLAGCGEEKRVEAPNEKTAAPAVLPVHQSGSYYAVLDNNEGCIVVTKKKKIVIEIPRVGIAYPVKYALVNVPLNLPARSFGKTYAWSPGVNLNSVTSPEPSLQGQLINCM